MSILISQVLSARHAEDGAVAISALKAASVRMPDREACAGVLTDAMNKASAEQQAAILEILAAVGGTNALHAVGQAAESPEESLRDVGSRLLGEWMTIDAAPVLLELAKRRPADKYQTRALRGYIRIADNSICRRKSATRCVSPRSAWRKNRPRSD